MHSSLFACLRRLVPHSSLNILNTAAASVWTCSAPLLFLFLLPFLFLARAPARDACVLGGGGAGGGGGRGAVLPPRGSGCAYLVYPGLGNRLLAHHHVPVLCLGLLLPPIVPTPVPVPGGASARAAVKW